MVEAVGNNNGVYSVDAQDRIRAGAATEVQNNRQPSTTTAEVQSTKKQADTVTISQEAVAAQQNTVQTAPEQARITSMEEAQNTAAQGAAKSNPMEAVAQAYGVSK